MAEKLVQSFDPLSYWVNEVADLDLEIVQAYKSNDKEKIEEIISGNDRKTFDVFICSDGGHAFLVLAEVSHTEPVYGPKSTNDNPYLIPGSLLCWKIDLRFEEVKLRTYKVSKKFQLFKDIEKHIKKTFYIGRYENVKSIKCFDLACLRAAPHHYNAIIDDCVEFAKEFCICLLSYCDCSKELEKKVMSESKKVSATGLSLETMSRNSFISGILGNISFGGVDVSSYLSGPHGSLIVLGIVAFLLLYPIFVAFLAVVIFKSYGT